MYTTWVFKIDTAVMQGLNLDATAMITGGASPTITATRTTIPEGGGSARAVTRSGRTGGYGGG